MFLRFTEVVLRKYYSSSTTMNITNITDITMVYKFFLYLLLIALYIYQFGLASFNRFNEESIVTINQILPISSREISRNPGKRSETDIKGFKNVF